MTLPTEILSHKRKDIEGLRAVAVCVVVINHAAPTVLTGGFIGVDIFLVISGYLIGLRLLHDLEAGSFSFLQFYERRARRLFPALMGMLSAVWGIGWIIFSGPEFTDLGKHIIAAALFSNNFLLWSQSGYFDAPSSTKPLLHLWSLGIEEQFYVLVPVLLWLDAKRHRSSIRWVLRLSVVSLVLTVSCPIASFYLLDTRFWELGAGVAIAYVALQGLRLQDRTQQPSSNARHLELTAAAMLLIVAAVLNYSAMQGPFDRSSMPQSFGLIVLILCAIVCILLLRIYRQPVVWARWIGMWRTQEGLFKAFAATAGSVLIGVSMVEISYMGWPGPQTVFPVLGAGLVIIAGSSTFINKVLASRPLVFVGGISYPLYLWHWPAIVFWRMAGFDTSANRNLIPVGCAFLLAWLTKECIEKPVRIGRFGSWPVRVPQIRLLIVGLLVVGIVGASTVATNGYPIRFPPTLRAVANWSIPRGDEDWRTDRCFFRPGITDDFAPECTPARRPGTQQILLWGDSHAAHLYPGLSDLQVEFDFDVLQWTSAACPPTRIHLDGEAGSCDKRRARALQTIARIAPDVVLLSADWGRYVPEGGSQASVLEASKDVIRWLQKIGIRRIVLFGPSPSWVNSESSDLFMYMLRNRLEKIPERIGGVSFSVHHLDAALAAQAAAAHVEYVSVADRLCDFRGCVVLADRRLSTPDLLFKDRDHLTPNGSRFVMKTTVPQIFGVR